MLDPVITELLWCFATLMFVGAIGAIAFACGRALERERQQTDYQRWYRDYITPLERVIRTLRQRDVEARQRAREGKQ